jgi:HD-GYP domain-containing protein (c-di-GMP phosphodiesterase class II)
MLAVCAGVTDPQELRQIARALRAHDVGMVVGKTEADISLMQAAVYTTGGLSPAQRALVDTHTHTGRAYVERLGFSRLEQAIVFGHHNPEQLARHLTPAQLRYVVLAQMADITDAWCSERPYPKAVLSPQDAATEVLRATRPDQALQDAYLRLVGVSGD